MMQELLLFSCLSHLQGSQRQGHGQGQNMGHRLKAYFMVNTHKVKRNAHRTVETGTKELEHLESEKQREAQLRWFTNARFCKDILSIQSLGTLLGMPC